MKIDLNNNLEVIQPYRSRSRDDFVQSFTDKKEKFNEKIRKLEVISQTTFPEKEDLAGEVYHNNYLEYLEHAYAHHYGVVLTPDIFWYTILCELTGAVAENPEGYRGLFTDQPEKKTITVATGSANEIPLKELTEALTRLIPTDIDTFLPQFSTSDLRSKFAHYAAFADMVSPYYNYCTFMCGLPYVVLKGDELDWVGIVGRLEQLVELFPDEQKYLDKVMDIAFTIITPSTNLKEFFGQMIYTKRCGSGSEQNLYGWWTDLYRNQPKYDVRKSENFATHVSKVNWTFLDTGAAYQLNTGIFSSVVNGDLLTPSFDTIILKKIGEAN